VILADFEYWKSAKLEILEEVDALVKCPDCDGWGESICECCESETGCKTCDGEGSVVFSEASGYTPDFKEYYSEYIADLKKYCEWKNDNLFEQMIIFIKELNNNHPNWSWVIR